MSFSKKQKGPLTSENLGIQSQQKSQATNIHPNLWFLVFCICTFQLPLYKVQQAGMPSRLFTTQEWGIFSKLSTAIKPARRTF